jgi:hypothetical protein
MLNKLKTIGSTVKRHERSINLINRHPALSASRLRAPSLVKFVKITMINDKVSLRKINVLDKVQIHASITRYFITTSRLISTWLVE